MKLLKRFCRQRSILYIQGVKYFFLNPRRYIKHIDSIRTALIRTFDFLSSPT